FVPGRVVRRRERSRRTGPRRTGEADSGDGKRGTAGEESSAESRFRTGQGVTAGPGGAEPAWGTGAGRADVPNPGVARRDRRGAIEPRGRNTIRRGAVRGGPAAYGRISNGRRDPGGAGAPGPGSGPGRPTRDPAAGRDARRARGDRRGPTPE